MTPGSVEAQRASVGAVDSPELKCGAWNGVDAVRIDEVFGT